MIVGCVPVCSIGIESLRSRKTFKNVTTFKIRYSYNCIVLNLNVKYVTGKKRENIIFLFLSTNYCTI